MPSASVRIVTTREGRARAAGCGRRGEDPGEDCRKVMRALTERRRGRFETSPTCKVQRARCKVRVLGAAC